MRGKTTRSILTGMALCASLGLVGAQETPAPAPATESKGPAEAARRGRQGGDVARLEALVTRYDEAKAKADVAALQGIEDDLRVILSGGRKPPASAGQADAMKSGPSAEKRAELGKELQTLLGKMDEPSLARKSTLLHEMLDLAKAGSAKPEPQ